jgi:hypothetical protein
MPFNFSAMSVRTKKPPAPPQKLHRWRISRIKATPAVDLGTVEAPDADAAIKVAIERYSASRTPGISSGW